MQKEAKEAILKNPDVILLSPTGTGKTLAFLLPIIKKLDPDCDEIQTLILVPSRELAIQIEQVIREMGSGYKTNALYGGRSGSKDKLEIKHRPAILIGTPGRIADHLRRDNFSASHINTLILDEFDKSLEIGFEKEMTEIIELLPKIKKRILTSATVKVEIPKFVGLENPTTVSYLTEKETQLDLKTVISQSRNKLETLVKTLSHIGNHPGIVFCNFKDTILQVSDYLNEAGIDHGCFYGGMEQIDRERALIKFRNRTHQLLIATDLAARGIDIPELKFIIHLELPNREQEFTHRNGRTARMNNEGTAYLIQGKNEKLSDFIKSNPVIELKDAPKPSAYKWVTLYITGGRKDKISKGDIAGLFLKQAKLNNNDLGIIELKQDFSFVSVKESVAEKAIELTNNNRLKKKKVRVSLI